MKLSLYQYRNFGSDESRKIFVQQIKKIEIAEAEKRKFIAELKVKKEKWVEFKNELEKKYEQYSDNLHALLDGDVKLYPHQIVASMFMNTTRSTLISHEMGLGKTLSAILYVEMNGFEKVVVITPNSLKFNFYEEVLKFTNSRAYIVNWRKNTCTIEDAKYVIVNYDFFNASIKSKRFDPKWQKLDIGRIDVVICDECQRLKNTKSNTYKNFKRTFNKKIFKGDKISKIFLSGTPAPNRAHELYTVLNKYLQRISQQRSISKNIIVGWNMMLIVVGVIKQLVNNDLKNFSIKQHHILIENEKRMRLKTFQKKCIRRLCWKWMIVNMSLMTKSKTTLPMNSLNVHRLIT